MNAEFFDKVEGPTLVRISRSRVGGMREYHLINNGNELAEIVAKLPPQTRVDLSDVTQCVWECTAIVPNQNGTVTKGSY